MVRNEREINIRWMFTLSLLFHFLFLFTVSYSNLFSRLYRPSRISTPLSAIHVNLIDIPKESIAEVPVAEKPVIDQRSEIGSRKSEVRSQKSGVRSQKSEERVQKAKMAIPEPLIKEKSPPLHPSPIKEEGQREGMDAQHQEVSPTPDSGDKPTGLPGGQMSGIQQARLSPDVPMISGPVDIPDFKYDYYLGVIRNKIDSRWSQPVVYSQVKQALIEFTIRRNGEIGNIKVSESSGDHYFDQTALRAVSLSNPFPPLPRGYKESFLKVRYRFIFGGKG